jgi:hypothetical protein
MNARRAVAVSMTLTVIMLSGAAAAQQMITDYSVDFDLTPRHLMPYKGDCSGGGHAGVMIRETALVALADVECPQNYGVPAKGQQLLIMFPDKSARSIPVSIAIGTTYHVRVIVTGQTLNVSVQGLGDLSWENAPMKANPTAYPKTVLQKMLAEVTGFKVAWIQPQKQPAPGQETPAVQPAPTTAQPAVIAPKPAAPPPPVDKPPAPAPAPAPAKQEPPKK